MPAHSNTSILPRAIRRVLELIREESGSGFSVTDIAAFAGVPRRTLQRQFRQYFGKTVFATLHDRRFDRARRELLRGATGISVSDVALRCGFTHLARFSAEYRRRYHELPIGDPTATHRPVRFTASMPIILTSRRELPTLHPRPIREHPRGQISGGRRARTDRRKTQAQPRGERGRSGAGPLPPHRTPATENVIAPPYPAPERGDRRQVAVGELLCAFLRARRRFRGARRQCGNGGIEAAHAVAEIRSARSRPTAHLTAYELALRALPQVLRLEHHAADQAISRSNGHSRSTRSSRWPWRWHPGAMRSA